MKLKKIASLMLAGVMAVSMLAGCSNNGGNNNNNNNDDPVVNTGLTGSVIAALDEDTTKNVTFSANSNLQAVLEKVVKNVGYDGLSALKGDALVNVDPDLGKYEPLPVVSMSQRSENTDKEVQTAVGLVYVNGQGMNAETVARVYLKTQKRPKKC